MFNDEENFAVGERVRWRPDAYRTHPRWDHEATVTRNKRVALLDYPYEIEFDDGELLLVFVSELVLADNSRLN